MRFLRRASWFTVLLTLSLSEAKLYYPAGQRTLFSYATERVFCSSTRLSVTGFLSGSALQIECPFSGIGVLISEALVDANFGDVAWKGVLPREERCTSLMGPSCFYTGNSGVACLILCGCWDASRAFTNLPQSSDLRYLTQYMLPAAAPFKPESRSKRTQESSGLSLGDHPAQEHPEEALQCDVGIMAQYLQASQSQLGAVHGHSETLSEHWQQIGAAREGKLDDVVHVKVGRGGSVRSVYDRTENLRGLDQAVASVNSGTASEMCNADEIDQPHMHKGEQQAAMGAAQSKCEWSSSSDKAAEESASDASFEYTDDKQQRFI